ncbi:transcriptional regulator, AlpA family [Desulfacinum hydrothermale DSM 13146]|uniref:Transcriptional regulator, AlpA family n=1 Tax=Desulfacinum hydrothermale DSM 13146 TaxID=1121390 RepID=A0A1W1XXE8_9BACT|nr:helix-turn-helix domain-containing protein [Desulfacinum hydrothermale]SMC28527.1 transcriptional regulator, AlpA family [Desulfacinum hydrothermale DSM 13146]
MAAATRELWDKKSLFRIDEVAEILGVSRRTVYRLIEAGVLDVVRVGLKRGLRVKASSIRELCA